MALQRCPVCSSSVPDTARACPVCGAPIATSDTPQDPDLIGVLSSGTQLNQGSYSVGRVLGRGGFGITYLGADLRLKRAVAIKEFFPAGSTRQGTRVILSGALSRADYEMAIQKFMQEAQMVARFRHRSIVNVYEVFQENDTAFMVMEYLDGEHLLERMERRGAPLDEAELIAISGPVAEALDEIHAAGVLHRDIKPENIMLVGSDDTPRPVLIDFGAAREFASGMVNRHSIVLTPGYAPLEQYGEQSRRGPFTDVYAFAATLYHVATGVQPPAATERALGVALKPPRDLNPALSQSFDAALLHGLEMKVDQRPASATAFHAQMTTGRPAANAPSPRTTPRPAVPAPPPVPAPSGATTHLGRVKEIAAQLGPASGVQSDRLICPVCRGAEMFDTTGAMTEVRCPVCRSARLDAQVSADDPLLCPSCSNGHLTPVDLSTSQIGAMLRCPACRTGTVVGYAATKLLIPDLRASCNVCEADFDFHIATDSLTLEDLPTGSQFLSEDSIGETRTRAEWQAMAGGDVDAYLCDVCDAAFQTCDDGSLEWIAAAGDPDQVPRAHRGVCRSRSEWARIASRLPAGVASVVCPACAAQFDEPAAGQLTLLNVRQDPYGFAAQRLGVTHRAAVWGVLAAGRQAPGGSGVACPACTAYLQDAGRSAGGRSDARRLVSFDPATDPYGIGARYDGQELSTSDWQRIAGGGLPDAEEQRLREEARRAFWNGMLAGEITTSTAKESIPVPLAAGEKAVITFAAVMVRTRFGFLYDEVDGQVWLTTRQIVFRGGREQIVVPLETSTGCELADMGQGNLVVEINGSDGSPVLRFYMDSSPMEFQVDGLTVPVQWDERAFAELFESLRRNA